MEWLGRSQFEFHLSPNFRFRRVRLTQDLNKRRSFIFCSTIGMNHIFLDSHLIQLVVRNQTFLDATEK